MALTLTESTTGLRAPRLAHARRRLGRLAVVTSAVAMLLTVAGTPALAADPSRANRVPVVIGVAIPTERIRTVDLSRDGAAVTQYTSYWCVPAAVQTMLNLINRTSDRSFATQSQLYTELRRSNRYTYSTRGNDVRGWATVLSAHLPTGMGYEDVSFASRSDAYLAIVKAMDQTKRPVGIVVDQATHAWTVVGFTVRETPGVPNSTTVLGFYVVGPLGAPTDPWPKKYLTVSQLNTRFTRYHEATPARRVGRPLRHRRSPLGGRARRSDEVDSPATGASRRRHALASARLGYVAVHESASLDPAPLDAADPLASFRDRFVISDPAIVYLDGNSLGRCLPRRRPV